MLLSDSKTKNTSRSILWGGINKIAGILLSFAVRTEIIYFLGVEYTGLGIQFNTYRIKSCRTWLWISTCL